MARKVVQLDEAVYKKLTVMQKRYKEQYNKFISLSTLISLIISLPTFVTELTHK